MTTSRFFTFFCALALAAFIGCGDTEAPAADDIAEDDTMAEDGTMEDDTMAGDSPLVVAEGAGLTTFRTAVAQAGLDETLSGEGPFTIFAPSDEAFQALPEGTLESLLEEENRDQLTKILTYHVLPTSAMSGDISGQLNVASVQGQELAVAAADGGVTVTDAQGNVANVTSADMATNNGVIHVIDSVLLPADDM
ncbi:MAG: fasciclin domain-containing protein [Bacteroidota bacterium]